MASNASTHAGATSLWCSKNKPLVGGRSRPFSPQSAEMSETSSRIIEDSSENRLRAKLDAVSAPSKPWQPAPGDELVGRFVGWTSRTTRRNESHPVALLETSAGETFAVWAFYRVLREELHAADPKPGETVLIRREADRVGPNGPYRVYRVAVDRDEPDQDHRGGDWVLAEGGAR